MERLTTSENYCDVSLCPCITGHPDSCPDGSCDNKKFYDRLAAIEDILGPTYDLARLKELVEADREGRCVVLPFKVGDILYYANRFRNEVSEIKVLDFPINHNGLNEVGCLGGGYTPIRFYLCDIGQTVFLTREETEKALKEGIKC